MKSELRSFQAHPEDMIESIEKIMRNIQTVKDADDFLTNDMVVDAVTRK